MASSKDSGKVDLIYDLLKESRQDVYDFRKEVLESQQEVSEKLAAIQVESASAKEKITSIERLDEIQNLQLAEHMRRTAVLEQLHQDNQIRIEKLEEPRKWIITGKKILITIGTIAGAVAGILKLLKVY